jgi:hypothetical protein
MAVSPKVAFSLLYSWVSACVLFRASKAGPSAQRQMDRGEHGISFDGGSLSVFLGSARRFVGWIHAPQWTPEGQGEADWTGGEAKAKNSRGQAAVANATTTLAKKHSTRTHANRADGT